MATEIKMPPLAQTANELRLIRWMVQEGQEVKRGDPLCEVESDKSVMPLESFESGTLLKRFVAEDTIVQVGAVIAILGKQGEVVTEAGNLPSPKSEAPAEEPKPKPSRHSPAQKADAVRATRLVRHMASRMNVDLSQVKGSGPQGLITRKDLEQSSAVPRVEVEEQAAQQPAKTAAGVLSPQQRVIARNLAYSKAHIPHYYVRMEIETDAMLRWREMNPHPDGRKVSYDAIFLHGVARVLGRFPRLNDGFQNSEIVSHRDINIGFAVAVGTDLVVPVVRNADQKGIREIDHEVGWLTAKARNRKLDPEDQAGGTFTITNLGMYPVQDFSAIINPHQVSILAFGRIHKSLQVDSANTMKVISALTVTGSFDHRAINGAQAAEFLAAFKAVIERELI